MATYQYIADNIVKRLSDGVVIPRSHRDWYNPAGRGHCFICEAEAQGLEFDANGDPIPDGSWLLDVPEPSLDSVLDDALRTIDRSAERARERHAAKLRHSVGATYRQKYDEARAYADAGYPSGSIADYPYIQAEADRKGVSYQTVADDVIAKHDAWQGTDQALNPQIEAERTGGKDDCRAAYDAGDRTGIETARDDAVAALDKI